MIKHIKESLLEAQNVLARLIANEETIRQIEAAARILISAFENGNRVFSCGNGGSMSDAIHFAEELTGRYRKNRKGYPAAAISDVGHLTCVANDFGFEHVFSRYIESHGTSDDCLVAISTSGNSRNVINAVTAANGLNIRTISLTGRPDTALEKRSDVCIITPGSKYADRVQELHIKVLHIIIEMVERHFHPENYFD